MSATPRQLGPEVQGFVPPPHPAGLHQSGAYVALEPLSADLHAADLHRAFSVDDALWDYLGYGPFAGAAAYYRWVKEREASLDPVFFALRDRATGHACGVASFLRIDPANGVLETGHICLSPELQRSRAATEAMFLMLDWSFSAGYRRHEWKCDALNVPSRRAAARLGYTFEGIFRQHMIVKGRNRDTAWFSVIDSEWQVLRPAFVAWLDAGNFTDDGRQIQRLSDLVAAAREGTDISLL